MKIEIYTDGGCHGNPGVGAWAFVIIKDGVVVFEKSGKDNDTTNNKMELTAAIEAILALKELNIEEKTVSLYTDSDYLKSGITVWVKNWLKRGWKTSDKKPVKNMEFWKRLLEVTESYNINWNWVKGHSGKLYNERCDELVQKEVGDAWSGPAGAA